MQRRTRLHRFVVPVLAAGLAVMLLAGCSSEADPALVAETDTSGTAPDTESAVPDTAGADTAAADTAVGAPDGADTADTTAATFADRLCDAAPPVEAGTVADPDLDELSGLVAADATSLWAIEDSGNVAELVRLGIDGATLARVPVPVAAVDWEDLAVDRRVGADPVSSAPVTLVIADTGDNARARTEVALHDIEIAFAADGTPSVVGSSTLAFAYPDVAHDVEALVIDPVDGARYVVTKALDQRTFEFEPDTIVFRVPMGDGGGPVVAEEVARLRLGTARIVTGGDIAADGATIVLRTYDAVLVWNRPAGTPLAAAFDAEPCEAPAPREGFGEAIAVLADGAGFVTVAEAPNPPIWRVDAG